MSATPLEWAPLWAAMDASPAEWIPTTESMYWEMLGCVPPRAQRCCGAFLVGEANNTNVDGYPVYACFKHEPGDRYFARNLTVEQFRAEV
jgi:hypothetical protein